MRGKDSARHKMRWAIFDLDGTLLDSMGIWEEIPEKFCKAHGIETKLNLNKLFRSMTLTESAQFFNETFHLPYTTQETFDRLRDFATQAYEETVLLKPGVLEALEAFRLAGIPMGIASASERSHIEAALKRLGVFSYFKAICTCTEEGTGKDSPAVFLRCMEAIGGEKEHTVVFEDALHAVLTAKEAGFLVAGVYDKSGAYQREEIRKNSDFYFHTPDEWRSLL